MLLTTQYLDEAEQLPDRVSAKKCRLIARPLYPLIFLPFISSAFVPTETMPGWLQAFVNVNPISHLVSTVRTLMLGGSYGTDLAWTLGWMAVLLVVFVPLALWGYRKRA